MDQSTLSIVDHLEEMRRRMLRSLACILAFFPVGYFLSQPAIEWLKREFCTTVDRLYFMQPMELFFTRLKVGFFLALAGSFPYIASQVWRFVSPGLFSHERYYLSRFVVVSTLLFALGSSFALFLIYPAVLRFSVGMGTEDIAPMLQVKGVVSLAAMLMLGFGLMFQLPIVVFLLAISGLVEIETMKRARPLVVIIVFVISAILTPPDIISQCAMGIPAMILFEISLLVSSGAVKRRRARRAEEDACGNDDDVGASPPGAPRETAPPPETDMSSALPAGDDEPQLHADYPEQWQAEPDYPPPDQWDQWYTRHTGGGTRAGDTRRSPRPELRLRARRAPMAFGGRARGAGQRSLRRSGNGRRRPGNRP